MYERRHEHTAFWKPVNVVSSFTRDCRRRASFAWIATQTRAALLLVAKRRGRRLVVQEHCLRRHGFEICRIVLNAEVFLVHCVPGVCLTSGIVRSSLLYSCCLFSWVEFREMPVEAGATVGEDTTQSVAPNEKNAPVVNGNNVETLPKGIGKQVFNLLVYVAGICVFFFFIEVFEHSFRGGQCSYLGSW